MLISKHVSGPTVTVRAARSAAFALLLLVICFGVSDVSLVQASSFERVQENLYLFRDTCNVFVLKSGDQALLIESGSGAVLDHLGEIGVEKVAWVLHTHYHRDLTSGDTRLVGAGSRIAAAQGERNRYEDAHEYWQTKDFFELYGTELDNLGPTHDIPITRGLQDGDVLSWEGIELRALHTPGPTRDNLSFALENGGKKSIFCGELIAAPGKVWRLYESQWQYMGAKGLANHVWSLGKLYREKPDLLLPAHGGVMEADTLEAIESAGENLAAVTTMIQEATGWSDDFPEGDWRSVYWGDDPAPVNPGEGPYFRESEMYRERVNPDDPDASVEVQQLFPHLYRQGMSYFIVADNGEAMVIDAGEGSMKAAAGELERVAGLRHVAWVTPSHYHNDHLWFLRWYADNGDAKMMVLDAYDDIIEHPERYNLPCLFSRGYHVDRILEEGEQFEWQGFRFRAFQLPGHTHYQTGLLAEMDGHRVLFTGDNFLAGSETPSLGATIIFRNRYDPGGGYVQAGKVLIEARAEYIASAHTGMSRITSQDAKEVLEWGKALEEKMRRAVAQPLGMALNWDWVSLYPYQVSVTRGESFPLSLRVRSYLDKPAEVSASMVSREGWRVAPTTGSVLVPAGGEAEVGFVVTVPSDAPSEKVPIVAEVMLDGRPLGQLAEAVVTVQ